MEKHWFWLWAALSTTFAAADTVKLAPAPFELPTRIGPLVYEGKAHVYEDPRLGVSYGYSAGGLVLTVYIYDMGIAGIPDGGDSITVCEQFETAKSDVEHAPSYKNVVLKSEQLVRLVPPQDAPLAREAVFELEVKSVPSVSYLWITGAGHYFVKLRFSVNGKLRDELIEARRTVLSALGDSIEPHLAPIDPKNKPQSTNIVIDAAGDTQEKGLSLTYLLGIAGSVDKNPGIAPVCGGRLIPDFTGEVHAFEGVLQVAKEIGASTFSRQLDEIARAGFLEEFVWTYRHSDDWGSTPPAGLDLEKFNHWSQRKLKHFKVPGLGYVEVNHPREMSVEAAP